MAGDVWCPLWCPLSCNIPWPARASPRYIQGHPARGGCPALLQGLLCRWCNAEPAPKGRLAPSSQGSAWQVGAQPYQGFWGSTAWLSTPNYQPKPPLTPVTTSLNPVLNCYWFSPAEAIWRTQPQPVKSCRVVRITFSQVAAL